MKKDIMSDLSEGEGGMMIMHSDKVDSSNGEDDDDQYDKGGGMKDENNIVRDCVV